MITMIAMQSMWTAMANFTIPEVDDDLEKRLRLRATEHGWSIEEEAR